MFFLLPLYPMQMSIEKEKIRGIGIYDFLLDFGNVKSCIFSLSFLKNLLEFVSKFNLNNLSTGWISQIRYTYPVSKDNLY